MKVFVEKFKDIKILRYELPGFENLSLRQKRYIFYLSKAALCGRDILFDQNGEHNLKLRRFLEELFESYKGNRKSDLFTRFHTYLKQIWFANGIHHHYSMDKFVPDFSELELSSLIKNSTVEQSFSKEDIDLLRELIFNPNLASKRVSLDGTSDLLKSSAMNFYRNVTQKEAEKFYEEKRKNGGKEAPSFGLNSQLVKESNQLLERYWKIGGLYSKTIEKIVYWLEKAKDFTENESQKLIIEHLITFYRTGDLAEFDNYSILWTAENEGQVDFVNGFIEVYGDPLGIKGSWESIVNYKDLKASERTATLSAEAAWFEAHSPIADEYRKKEVKGVSAKAIHVAALGGDCYPSTPIGVNLPNSEWIREKYGSKSVTIENITQAYFKDSLKNGMLEEFACSEEEIDRARKYGELASNLHTDLHECLGHGSGKMKPGVKPEDLKNYYSTIEEARADLFALYYMADPKILNLGLLPSEEAAWAEYDSYIRNGLLTQLTRIIPGKDLEESHMRNRQLIAKWAYEYGKSEKVIELVYQKGKTFIQINDYSKLRNLFGQLLSEIQRIKSEGDYDSARDLVENYGVKVDEVIHEEVLSRFEKLNIAPYAGFINPCLSEKVDREGNIIDIEVAYSQGYTEQMLDYSKNYSFES